MMNAELIGKLADVLQVSSDDFTEDFALNPETWDSFAQLSAIAVIDEVCGVIVPSNELKECRNVGELIALVGRNLPIT